MESGELLNRASHYDSPELVSRIDCLAEINGLDGKDLCTYEELSGYGEIWDYITDATVGVLYSSQHRGRAGTALDRGVCSVAWCCPRLFSGTRNVPDTVNKAGDDNAGAMQVLVGRLRRDQQNAQRIDQITYYSPLITLHSPLPTNHSPLSTLH